MSVYQYRVGRKRQTPGEPRPYPVLLVRVMRGVPARVVREALWLATKDEAHAVAEELNRAIRLGEVGTVRLGEVERG